MSLIKKLIQRLLDSRTTPTQAVQANRINVGEETTFNTDIFVPPRDGFVRVWGRIQQDSAGTAIGLITDNGNTAQGISRLAFLGASTENSIIQTWPVRKGETIRLEAFNLDIQLRTFFDAIGGYNILVRRALSCLKPSFNFSLKNSLLAEATGFPINPIRELPRRISHHQKQAIGLQLSPPAMDGSVLKLGLHKFCSATENFGRVHRRQLLTTWDFQCLSQKAGQWRMCCHRTQQNRSPSLFQALAIRANLLTGGMTC